MYENFTIAIPTYNRTKLLLENVLFILQNSKKCKLLVIDNATNNFELSDFKQSLGFLYIEHVERITFIKNEINIGGNANVLRCIENCKTEYIFILGDDDFLVADFEERVYKFLDKGYEWILFYHKSKFQPERAITTTAIGLNDFLCKLESINEIVFVSVNIYKVSHMKLGIQLAYENLSCMAPHVISMIRGVEISEAQTKQKQVFLISNTEILISASNNLDAGTSWPLYKAFTGIYRISDLEFNKTTSKLLKKLINKSRYRWLNNKTLIYSMATLTNNIGVTEAYRLTNSFIWSCMRVESFKAIFRNILYLTAIVFGKHFIKLNNYLKGNK
jgi:hypothetical protein